MSAKPIKMDQIRRIIQLLEQGASLRSIALQCGISRNTVRQYHKQITQSGCTYAQLLSLDDEKLSAVIYDSGTEKNNERLSVMEGLLESFKKELSKRGVTRQLLWQEYRLEHEDGYGYTQFCYYLERWLQREDAVMHFQYNPAEKMMVDFAGKKITVHRLDGSVHSYEAFLAILPFSGYTYMEVTVSQKQLDFLNALENALIFFTGVPLCTLMDNFKSGVVKADRYEPQLTDLMQQFGLHYNTTVMATRPYKPRDKASVEKAVHLAYERIYAPLRNRTFENLHQLNVAIAEQLAAHNRRPFRRSEQSREGLFLEQEKPLLRPLPGCRLAVKKVVQAKVQRNYHVVLGEDWHFYSVPFEHVGKQVEIHYTELHVEIYLDIKRVAVHTRRRGRNGYSTLAEHMPERHKHRMYQKGWDADYFRTQARKLSLEVEQAIDKILASRFFYEQTYNACLGILRLEQKYGKERLSAACSIALKANAVNYRFISNILKSGKDKALQQPALQNATAGHENIRGSQAYQ
jgi:transposase